MCDICERINLSGCSLAACCCEHNNEPLDFIKCGTVFETLNSHNLFKKDSGLWSLFKKHQMNTSYQIIFLLAFCVDIPYNIAVMHNKIDLIV